MARFRGYLYGGGGREVTRLGRKTLIVRANGWKGGVTVCADTKQCPAQSMWDEPTDYDVFEVFMTGGSGLSSSLDYLGRVVVHNGVPKWEPTEKSQHQEEEV